MISMQEIKLSGSYYDIGKKCGEILIPQKEKGYPPKFSTENIENSKPYEKEVKKYAPEILEELQGVADGSGVDYQVLVANELTPFRLNPNCLVIAFSSEQTISGKPMLVRNHEWIEEDSESLSVMTIQPKGKLASYGFTFNWPLTTRYGGINEAGVAISSATTAFVNTGPGVMLNVATRWILDNCKSTEEAVEFLEEIPKVWGVSYLIIDKNNTIAKVEAHREKTFTHYTANGFDYTTFIFSTPEMSDYNDKQRLGYIQEQFDDRKNFLLDWSAMHKGNVDEKKIIAALSNCDNKLHYHIKRNYGTEGTCWSWIIYPGSDDALISTGPLCKNEFKPYKIDFDFSKHTI